MIIHPKTIEESRNLVYSVLNQGDSRYNDPYDEYLLAAFLLHKSIIIEKREIPPIAKTPLINLALIKGPQEKEKYVATMLLKKEGFQDNEISFEQWIQGGKADVLAISKQKIIAVECCSCRVSKIIDYLSEENADIEVWVFTRGSPPWETAVLEKMEWFVFRKGRDFSFRLNKWREIQGREIRKALDKMYP
jgi:hypothetical protein